jgi:hypothetical protein
MLGAVGGLVAEGAIPGYCIASHHLTGLIFHIDHLWLFVLRTEPTLLLPPHVEYSNLSTMTLDHGTILYEIIIS